MELTKLNLGRASPPCVLVSLSLNLVSSTSFESGSGGVDRVQV